MPLETATSVIQFLTACINLCCGCLGPLLALAAVIMAYRAVRETRQNTQAQIASALLDAYSEREMVDDIEILKRWKVEHPENFAENFATQRHSDQQAKNVDRARRRLAHYHQKAAIMVKHKLIDHDLLKTVISKTQIEFAEEYVEPLEIAIALDTNPRWAYDILRTLHGLYRKK
jgi:hypothetical protein